MSRRRPARATTTAVVDAPAADDGSSNAGMPAPTASPAAARAETVAPAPTASPADAPAETVAPAPTASPADAPAEAAAPDPATTAAPAEARAPAAATPEDLPCRLARVATALFADKGYAAVSVREICEAAGTTKPMLYYYFGSKEGLFRRLIEETFERFNAILQDSEAKDLPFDEFLESYAAAHLQWVTERPEHARLVFATSMGHQRGAPAIDFPRFRDHNAGLLARIFLKAQSRGELSNAPPEDLIGAYLGIVVMACMRHLEPEQDDPLPISDRAAALARLFLDGAAPKSEVAS